MPLLVRLCALNLQVTNTFCYISEKLQSLEETQVSINKILYYYRLHVTLFVDILKELASWRSLWSPTDIHFIRHFTYRTALRLLVVKAIGRDLVLDSFPEGMVYRTGTMCCCTGTHSSDTSVISSEMVPHGPEARHFIWKTSCRSESSTYKLGQFTLPTDKVSKKWPVPLMDAFSGNFLSYIFYIYAQKAKPRYAYKSNQGISFFAHLALSARPCGSLGVDRLSQYHFRKDFCFDATGFKAWAGEIVICRHSSSGSPKIILIYREL